MFLGGGGTSLVSGVGVRGQQLHYGNGQVTYLQVFILCVGKHAAFFNIAFFFQFLESPINSLNIFQINCVCIERSFNKSVIFWKFMLKTC